MQAAEVHPGLKRQNNIGKSAPALNRINDSDSSTLSSMSEGEMELIMQSDFITLDLTTNKYINASQKMDRIKRDPKYVPVFQFYSRDDLAKQKEAI